MNKMDSPYSQEADSITETFTSVHAHIYREAQDTVKNAVKKALQEFRKGTDHFWFKNSRKIFVELHLN